jgi:hypothetical protein
MWLFTRYGFFSVACARKAGGGEDPDLLMIRARRRAHLEQLQARFPEIAGAEIIVTRDRDYRYRIVVAKTVWAGTVSELALEQTWSNFKNEAERFQGKAGSDYVRALHEVWDVMYELQGRE